MRLQLDEQVIEGKRLGRHVNHDPRSLNYQVKPLAALAQSVTWKRDIPVLDQGNLGSCTGNATVGVLGSEPYFATMPSSLTLNEDEAVSLYSLATRLDSYTGDYPPTDTGSDGLSVAKAAKTMGLISGYLHCTSIDAVITALQSGPVITGVNWYSGFDNPDSSGHVTLSGSVRGGHEFEIAGVDLQAKLFLAYNSWGPSWGLNGQFTFTFADYTRLLSEQGDATAFVPLTAPPPTPQPPGDADHALITALDPWASRPHVWHLATVGAAGYQAWKKAKGYS